MYNVFFIVVKGTSMLIKGSLGVEAKDKKDAVKIVYEKIKKNSAGYKLMEIENECIAEYDEDLNLSAVYTCFTAIESLLKGE